jgi:hypothetical protein
MGKYGSQTKEAQQEKLMKARRIKSCLECPE